MTPVIDGSVQPPQAWALPKNADSPAKLRRFGVRGPNRSPRQHSIVRRTMLGRFTSLIFLHGCVWPGTRVMLESLGSIIFRKIQTARHLGIFLCIETVLLALLAAPSLRVFGAHRTQAWLRRWTRTGATRRTSLRRVLAAHRIANRYAGTSVTCLSRSLCLWAALRKRGFDAELRTGLTRLDGKVEGHAWIELEGRVLNDRKSVADTYRPIEGLTNYDRFPEQL